MKKFTVKDFITYNGPCFSCQSKITFEIGVFNTKSKQVPAVYLTPTITNESIDIDLKINYRDSLSLRVFTKTNKFTTSSVKSLNKYLDEHGLFLRSKCDNCKTSVDSEAIEFNILKQFIAPVAISDERLVVRDDKHQYELYSSFKPGDQGGSIAIISSLNAAGKNNTQNKFIRIDLPLLPIYKLKNKERFIQKMKTYIVFS